MYQFHITGFVGNGTSYWSNLPIDITVFAENETQAIAKAETVLGKNISTSGRKVVVKELVGEDK